ncbi:MAG: hypothetical protein R3F37_05115, partial [Candidatus Competibacteraceae bacterium]
MISTTDPNPPQSLVIAFRELSPAILTEIANRTDLLTLGAGQSLFAAGQAYRKAVFVLHAGQLESQHPGQHTVLLRPGSV